MKRLCYRLEPSEPEAHRMAQISLVTSRGLCTTTAEE